MASLIGYNGPVDSLALPNAPWRHPEYSTIALAPKWVDVDSTAGAVEFLLPGFGTTYKAAVVVISLVDGAYGEYTYLANADEEQERNLPYRLNVGIRSAPFQSPNPRLVVRTAGVADDHPAWSPAGDEIAFFTTRGSAYTQIFRCRLSDTTLTMLAPQPHHQYAPDWSPRGDLIAFEQEGAYPRDDIWTYSVATQQLSQLTNMSGFATRPQFQPNGQRIAYLRFPATQGSSPELRRINVNGTNDTLLAILPSVGALGSLRWAPDGKWIYFVRAETLYAVSADGGAPISRVNLIPRVATLDFARGGGPLVVEELGQSLACGTPSVPFKRIALRDTLILDSQARYYQRKFDFGNPRWSFDGTRIAYASDQIDPSERDLYVGQVSYNHAPQFSPPLRDTILALPCQPYTFAFDLAATDPDGETVTYQAACLPPGATLASNHFTWPNPGPPGTDYYVVFRALDGSGGVDNKVVKFSLLPDPARPAAANDVALTMALNTATVTWTAPGDDSLLGTACRFDVRYSNSTITESNFGSLPDTIPVDYPGPAGTVHCGELHGLQSCRWYYVALKTRDDAGRWSALSKVASGKTQCSGYEDVSCDNGGMFAQGGGGDSWSTESSLLDQAALGQISFDGYQLRAGLQPYDGKYVVRLLKTGAGGVALDEVGLAAVDHPATTKAFLSGSRMVLGTVAPVYRVADGSGQDVTAAFSGGASLPYAGTPGEALLVQLNQAGASGEALMIETAAGGPATSADSSGILIQVPTGSGGWGTIAWHHPRGRFDRFLADSLESGTVRLVFLGEHQVRFIGRVAKTGAATPQRLTLVAARHSRLGDVPAAVGAAGGTTATLAPGDALTLSFTAPSLAADRVRDWALFVRGTRVTQQGALATRARPVAEDQPASYALYQNQPNPFATSTTLRFDLPRPETVRLEVFDLVGRRVATLSDAWMPAGRHSIEWDSRDAGGSPVRPGAYVYRLSAGSFRAQRKLVVLP